MSRRQQLRRLPWRLRYHYLAGVASSWRRLGVKVTHLHADVRIERPVRLGPGFTLDIPDAGHFHAAAGCDFRRAFACEISGAGHVDIGAGSIFTGDVLLQISTSLTIGRRCVFAQSVSVADGNHRFRDPTLHTLDQGYDYRPIVIDDGALILAKATVLASVGAHAVIGANSVVTRPVPAYCLAVGAPARVIEFFGPPELRPQSMSCE